MLTDLQLTEMASNTGHLSPTPLLTIVEGLGDPEHYQELESTFSTANMLNNFSIIEIINELSNL